MAPECTVTDVRARVVSASGFVEVVEDAVGTNNLHVMLEYEVDRDDARFEIAWTVDHPPGADCSLP